MMGNGVDPYQARKKERDRSIPGGDGKEKYAVFVPGSADKERTTPGHGEWIAPVCSMFARVVSKWVLLGNTLPGPPITENRIFSAARPWCVGMMCLKGKSPRTAASKR